MPPYIGLIQHGNSSLSQSLELAKRNKYSVLAASLNSSGLPHEFEKLPMADEEYDNSYPDLVMTAVQWNAEMIAIISENADCDSNDPEVRRRSEIELKHDIALAEYLLSGGYMLLQIRSGNITNTARIVANCSKENVLVQVPAFNPKLLQANWRRDIDVMELQRIEDEENTWEWWNKFRWVNDFNPKLKVVLELNSEDVFSDDCLRRWLGEPVDAVVIPASMFVRNKSNSPILPQPWVNIVKKFIRAQVSILISASPYDNNLKEYAEYCKRMQTEFSTLQIFGYEDVLEIPLQPLHDNLNCYTYEVFEKDPIKYILYQKAIIEALIDRVPEDEINTNLTVIMILGAGRGPLIRAALNASSTTRRHVRIYVIEKNPNAIRTLKNITKKLWHDKDVRIFSKDMRLFSPPEKADILVSELLGSFGDNELSPECLDCAESLLKDDGISIPSKSISFINPMMSSKIYCAVRNISRSGALGNDKYAINHIHPESGFVVLLRNVFHIDFPQPLFEFVHPNRSESKDNTRYKVLKFNVTMDSVLNGVAGYFEAILYNDIIISINPSTHTLGMQSWFPMFFPFTNPIDVKKGDIVEIHFWRCVDNYKVWYEWCLVSPVKTHVHNLNGRWCPIYLS